MSRRDTARGAARAMRHLAAAAVLAVLLAAAAGAPTARQATAVDAGSGRGVREGELRAGVGVVREDSEELVDDEALEPAMPKDEVVTPKEEEPVPEAEAEDVADDEAVAEVEEEEDEKADEPLVIEADAEDEEEEEEDEEEEEEDEVEEDDATARAKAKAREDEMASPEADADEEDKKEEEPSKKTPKEKDAPSLIEDEKPSKTGGVFESSDTAADDAAEKEDAKRCFPGAATVTLESGATIPMSALALGDSVLVADGAYSRVFMFTHADADATSSFVRIHVAAGRAVTATAGHYVLVDGRGLVAAAAVRVGDRMQLGGTKPAWSHVTATHIVSGVGLYNPQTLSGDIVVDGLVVSTYTTAVTPAVAHALLAPLRVAFSYLGLVAPTLHSGAPALAAFAPVGAPVVDAL